MLIVVTVELQHRCKMVNICGTYADGIDRQLLVVNFVFLPEDGIDPEM